MIHYQTAGLDLVKIAYLAWEYPDLRDAQIRANLIAFRAPMDASLNASSGRSTQWIWTDASCPLREVTRPVFEIYATDVF